MTLRRAFSLSSGPLIAALFLALPTPSGLTAAGQGALATLSFCVCWWVLSPVPLPVTSLLGLALLPIFGALPTSQAMALFGSPAVFFVIGVFLVASVMLETGLSSRLSLSGLRRFGKQSAALCNALLFLSWGLCLVMVSHAVAALLLPIVLSIISALGLSSRDVLARRLLLSMAWGTVCGSNIGLLSSARASLALELFSRHQGVTETQVGMIQYSLATIPISLGSLLCVWVLLSWRYPVESCDLSPAVKELSDSLSQRGPVSREEWLAAGLLITMVVTMVVLGAPWLAVVALLFSGIFFAFGLLRWDDAERYVNWGVALLYGGAIAVGSAVHLTGAASWVVNQLVPQLSSPLIVFTVLAIIIALFTELISNSAVIAIVLPVALAMAEKLGINPLAVAVMAPVCAGFAFVLPTSTPAMAMVFGVGYLRSKDTIWGALVAFSSLIVFAVVAWFWWPMIGISVVE